MNNHTQDLDRKRRGPDLSSIVYGKVPPQAPDLEEAMLGAMMIDENCITTVLSIVDEECFYDDRHRLIFSAIKDLYKKNEPIDLLTTTEKLRKMGRLEEAGGPYYVTTLTGRVATSAHAEYHTRVVMQKYIAREIIRISTEGVHDAYEDVTDIFDLLFSVEREFSNINKKIKKTGIKTKEQQLAELVKKIDKARLDENSLRGIPSGFQKLDRFTGGWQKTDLIIIAARPSMGKTALALNCAINAAKDHHIPVSVYELEMSCDQVNTRFISDITEIDNTRIARGLVDEFQMKKIIRATSLINEAPIYVDDTPALSPFDLKLRIRRDIELYDIQLAFVDYIQLMSTGNETNKKYNREQEVSEISRQLKAIAKEFKIPVIALSQLSRKVEDRGGQKRPMLSDLRESGSIEQDADVVIFLYRPEYYNIEVDENGNSTKGLAEVIFAKHRNGPLGTVYLDFKHELTKFCDPVMEYSTQPKPIERPTNKRF